MNDYIAFLPQQSAFLVWDAQYKRWAATQDRRLATKKSYESWVAVKATITQKFKVIKAS